MKQVVEGIVKVTSNSEFETATFSMKANLEEVDGGFIEENSGGGGGVKRIEAETIGGDVHSNSNGMGQGIKGKPNSGKRNI